MTSTGPSKAASNGRGVEGEELVAPLRLLVIAAVAMLALAFIVSAGLFNIDEFIYLSGARAFLERGSFAVSNAFGDSASADLRLWLLVDGPNGLTPQYPAGPAILGAPLLALFGTRGLMLLNVLAGIALLPVTWQLTKQNLGGERVAFAAVLLLTLGTFWLEYVYAIWPHSVSVLGVTTAFALTLACLRDGREPVKRGAMAGAAVGAAVLFRTDSVLAGPAIGFAVLLFAERPIRFLAAAAAGALPFVAAAALINLAKFGTLNPFSYGRTGSGSTSFSSHLSAVILLALASLALLGLRHLRWRPTKPQLIGAVAVAGVLVLLVSPVREAAGKYLSGAWALLADSTTIVDPRPGVVAQADGTLSFWGLWKKALGQSMPWLGLLLLALHQQTTESQRRVGRFLLIACFVWSLPFFFGAWHGGMGSNMRYFLPLVPMLCVYSAGLLLDFIRSIAGGRILLRWGAIGGMVLLIGWTMFHRSGLGGAQQILSTYVFLAIALLALAAGFTWARQTQVRQIALAAIGGGLAFSAAFLLSDFMRAQQTREAAVRVSTMTRALPDNSLVYAPARFVSDWSLKKGNTIALPHPQNAQIDTKLVETALSIGHRVFIWPNYVKGGLDEPYLGRLRKSEVAIPGGYMLEIVPTAPAVLPIIETRQPPLLITNSPVLSAALEPSAAHVGYRLNPTDEEALRTSYVQHWGPIWVAGKNLDEASGSFGLSIPGTYTLECSGSRTIDGLSRRCGSTVSLNQGAREWSGGSAVLRWGEHLPRPSGAPPERPIYYGF